MTNCKYYREDIKEIRSKECGRGRQPAEILRASILWCSHPESPVTRERAYCIGQSKVLDCKGSIENCLVGKEL